jgi:uncharacterized protein YbjT (DUF2867 family)
MIFVTGGTGMVGGEIVRLLSQNGTAARALVRNPKNAKNLPVITWVTGDLAKPETLPAAFEGAKTLFLISSIGEDTVALQHNAIEAAPMAITVEHKGDEIGGPVTGIYVSPDLVGIATIRRLREPVAIGGRIACNDIAV